jgi:hypothetical protein
MAQRAITGGSGVTAEFRPPCILFIGQAEFSVENFSYLPHRSYRLSAIRYSRAGYW